RLPETPPLGWKRLHRRCVGSSHSFHENCGVCETIAPELDLIDASATGRPQYQSNRFPAADQIRHLRARCPTAGDVSASQPGEIEMDAPIKVRPAADLRDYLAEERT